MPITYHFVILKYIRTGEKVKNVKHQDFLLQNYNEATVK